MTDDHDRQHDKALCRYHVISPYLAMDPPRGRRRQLLEHLASRTWAGPDGQPFSVAAETIRTWVRRYRRRGLDGLRDKPRPKRGVQALTPEQVELVCRLKTDVPERSVDRIITIAEQMGLAPPGVLRRSTVHRVLRSRGISRRPAPASDRKDLDRFEADAPNDLWQSDLLVGPWLPDPARPGRVRRAHLYAFLDDHSRLMLHGRFSFKGDLPALELVFRRSLQKYGVCRRVYYDNGQVYRSGHMRQIVAELGMQGIIHTKPYRPEGHGKIEAFNRSARTFVAELKSSSIDTLDGLNEAFLAWVDLEYNRSLHTDIGCAPLQRWRAGIDRVRYADEADLQRAFTWRERRTPDKTGVFSLFGVRYQVGSGLAKRRIEVRYDAGLLDRGADGLQEVEVWHDGAFVQRARPLQVQSSRRPRKQPEPATAPAPDKLDREPLADWLGHLITRRREQFGGEPTPRQLAETRAAERADKDRGVTDLLREHLPAEVFDADVVADYLRTYGPFSLDAATVALARLRADGRADAHVTVHLDAVRAEHNRGASS